MSAYRELAVARVEPNPDQPRKHFDPAALTELAESIKSNGLLEPIVVRPHPSKPAGWWLLIAGERRWRACKQADITKIEARILDVDEATAFELSVAENVNRHDMTPIEEAQAYATLRGYDRDVAAIAKLFGKTDRYVSLRMELLDLSEEAQAQVAAGRIAVSVAQQMARLNQGNQQAMLFRLMKGDFANDNEALHMAYALYQGQSQMSMFSLEEPTEEERDQRKRTKKRVLGLLDAAEKLGEVIADLSVVTPEEFAAAGTDSRRTLARLDRMARQITKARFNARQGSAVADARNHLTTTNEETA